MFMDELDGGARPCGEIPCSDGLESGGLNWTEAGKMEIVYDVTFGAHFMQVID